MESYVSNLLVTYLTKFVKNIQPEQLKVSLWRGNISLSHIELKYDLLADVFAPIVLVSGWINQLTVTIPWAKLQGDRINVTLDDVTILLMPRKDVPYDPITASRIANRAKQASLNLWERSRNAADPSPAGVQVPTRMLKFLISRLNVVAKNILVRYEDPHGSTGCYELRIDSLTMRPPRGAADAPVVPPPLPPSLSRVQPPRHAQLASVHRSDRSLPKPEHSDAFEGLHAPAGASQCVVSLTCASCSAVEESDCVSESALASLNVALSRRKPHGAAASAPLAPGERDKMHGGAVPGGAAGGAGGDLKEMDKYDEDGQPAKVTPTPAWVRALEQQSRSCSCPPAQAKADSAPTGSASVGGGLFGAGAAPIGPRRLLLLAPLDASVVIAADLAALSGERSNAAASQRAGQRSRADLFLSCSASAVRCAVSLGALKKLAHLNHYIASQPQCNSVRDLLRSEVKLNCFARPGTGRCAPWWQFAIAAVLFDLRLQRFAAAGLTLPYPWEREALIGAWRSNRIKALPRRRSPLLIRVDEQLQPLHPMYSPFSSIELGEQLAATDYLAHQYKSLHIRTLVCSVYEFAKLSAGEQSLHDSIETLLPTSVLLKARELASAEATNDEIAFLEQRRLLEAQRAGAKLQSTDSLPKIPTKGPSSSDLTAAGNNASLPNLKADDSPDHGDGDASAASHEAAESPKQPSGWLSWFLGEYSEEPETDPVEEQESLSTSDDLADAVKPSFVRYVGFTISCDSMDAVALVSDDSFAKNSLRYPIASFSAGGLFLHHSVTGFGDTTRFGVRTITVADLVPAIAPNRRPLWADGYVYPAASPYDWPPMLDPTNNANSAVPSISSSFPNSRDLILPHSMAPTTAGKKAAIFSSSAFVFACCIDKDYLQVGTATSGPSAGDRKFPSLAASLSYDIRVQLQPFTMLADPLAVNAIGRWATSTITASSFVPFVGDSARSNDTRSCRHSRSATPISTPIRSPPRSPAAASPPSTRFAGRRLARDVAQQISSGQALLNVTAIIVGPVILFPSSSSQKPVTQDVAGVFPSFSKPQTTTNTSGVAFCPGTLRIQTDGPALEDGIRAAYSVCLEGASLSVAQQPVIDIPEPLVAKFVVRQPRSIAFAVKKLHSTYGELLAPVEPLNAVACESCCPFAASSCPRALRGESASEHPNVLHSVPLMSVHATLPVVVIDAAPDSLASAVSAARSLAQSITALVKGASAPHRAVFREGVAILQSSNPPLLLLPSGDSVALSSMCTVHMSTRSATSADQASPTLTRPDSLNTLGRSSPVSMTPAAVTTTPGKFRNLQRPSSPSFDNREYAQSDTGPTLPQLPSGAGDVPCIVVCVPCGLHPTEEGCNTVPAVFTLTAVASGDSDTTREFFAALVAACDVSSKAPPVDLTANEAPGASMPFNLHAYCCMLHSVVNVTTIRLCISSPSRVAAPGTPLSILGSRNTSPRRSHSGSPVAPMPSPLAPRKRMFPVMIIDFDDVRVVTSTPKPEDANVETPCCNLLRAKISVGAIIAAPPVPAKEDENLVLSATLRKDLSCPAFICKRELHDGKSVALSVLLASVSIPQQHNLGSASVGTAPTTAASLVRLSIYGPHLFLSDALSSAADAFFATTGVAAAAAQPGIVSTDSLAQRCRDAVLDYDHVLHHHKPELELKFDVDALAVSIRTASAEDPGSESDGTTNPPRQTTSLSKHCRGIAASLVACATHFDIKKSTLTTSVAFSVNALNMFSCVGSEFRLCSVPEDGLPCPAYKVPLLSIPGEHHVGKFPALLGDVKSYTEVRFKPNIAVPAEASVLLRKFEVPNAADFSSAMPMSRRRRCLFDPRSATLPLPDVIVSLTVPSIHLNYSPDTVPAIIHHITCDRCPLMRVCNAISFTVSSQGRTLSAAELAAASRLVAESGEDFDDFMELKLWKRLRPLSLSLCIRDMRVTLPETLGASELTCRAITVKSDVVQVSSSDIGSADACLNALPIEVGDLLPWFQTPPLPAVLLTRWAVLIDSIAFASPSFIFGAVKAPGNRPTNSRQVIPANVLICALAREPWSTVPGSIVELPTSHVALSLPDLGFLATASKGLADASRVLSAVLGAVYLPPCACDVSFELSGNTSTLPHWVRRVGSISAESQGSGGTAVGCILDLDVCLPGGNDHDFGDLSSACVSELTSVAGIRVFEWFCGIVDDRTAPIQTPIREVCASEWLCFFSGGAITIEVDSFTSGIELSVSSTPFRFSAPSLRAKPVSSCVEEVAYRTASVDALRCLHSPPSSDSQAPSTSHLNPQSPPEAGFHIRIESSAASLALVRADSSHFGVPATGDDTSAEGSLSKLPALAIVYKRHHRNARLDSSVSLLSMSGSAADLNTLASVINTVVAAMVPALPTPKPRMSPSVGQSTLVTVVCGIVQSSIWVDEQVSTSATPRAATQMILSRLQLAYRQERFSPASFACSCADFYVRDCAIDGSYQSTIVYLRQAPPHASQSSTLGNRCILVTVSEIGHLRAPSTFAVGVDVGEFGVCIEPRDLSNVLSTYQHVQNSMSVFQFPRGERPSPEAVSSNRPLMQRASVFRLSVAALHSVLSVPVPCLAGRLPPAFGFSVTRLFCSMSSTRSASHCDQSCAAASSSGNPFPLGATVVRFQKATAVVLLPALRGTVAVVGALPLGELSDVGADVLSELQSHPDPQKSAPKNPDKEVASLVFTITAEHAVFSLHPLSGLIMLLSRQLLREISSVMPHTEAPSPESVTFDENLHVLRNVMLRVAVSVNNLGLVPSGLSQAYLPQTSIAGDEENISKHLDHLLSPVTCALCLKSHASSRQILPASNVTANTLLPSCVSVGVSASALVPLQLCCFKDTSELCGWLFPPDATSCTTMYPDQTGTIFEASVHKVSVPGVVTYTSKAATESPLSMNLAASPRIFKIAATPSELNFSPTAMAMLVSALSQLRVFVPETNSADSVLHEPAVSKKSLVPLAAVLSIVQPFVSDSIKGASLHMDLSHLTLSAMYPIAGAALQADSSRVPIVISVNWKAAVVSSSSLFAADTKLSADVEIADLDISIQASSQPPAVPLAEELLYIGTLQLRVRDFSEPVSERKFTCALDTVSLAVCPSFGVGVGVLQIITDETSHLGSILSPKRASGVIASAERPFLFSCGISCKVTSFSLLLGAPCAASSRTLGSLISSAYLAESTSEHRHSASPESIVGVALYLREACFESRPPLIAHGGDFLDIGFDDFLLCSVKLSQSSSGSASAGHSTRLEPCGRISGSSSFSLLAKATIAFAADASQRVLDIAWYCDPLEAIISSSSIAGYRSSLRQLNQLSRSYTSLFLSDRASVSQGSSSSSSVSHWFMSQFTSASLDGKLPSLRILLSGPLISQPPSQLVTSFCGGQVSFKVLEIDNGRPVSITGQLVHNAPFFMTLRLDYAFNGTEKPASLALRMYMSYRSLGEGPPDSVAVLACAVNFLSDLRSLVRSGEPSQNFPGSSALVPFFVGRDVVLQHDITVTPNKPWVFSSSAAFTAFSKSRTSLPTFVLVDGQGNALNIVAHPDDPRPSLVIPPGVSLRLRDVRLYVPACALSAIVSGRGGKLELEGTSVIITVPTASAYGPRLLPSHSRVKPSATTVLHQRKVTPATSNVSVSDIVPLVVNWLHPVGLTLDLQVTFNFGIVLCKSPAYTTPSLVFLCKEDEEDQWKPSENLGLYSIAFLFYGSVRGTGSVGIDDCAASTSPCTGASSWDVNCDFGPLQAFFLLPRVLGTSVGQSVEGSQQDTISQSLIPPCRVVLRIWRAGTRALTREVSSSRSVTATAPCSIVVRASVLGQLSFYMQPLYFAIFDDVIASMSAGEISKIPVSAAALAGSNPVFASVADVFAPLSPVDLPLIADSDPQSQPNNADLTSSCQCDAVFVPPSFAVYFYISAAEFLIFSPHAEWAGKRALDLPAYAATLSPLQLLKALRLAAIVHLRDFGCVLGSSNGSILHLSAGVHSSVDRALAVAAAGLHTTVQCDGKLSIDLYNGDVFRFEPLLEPNRVSTSVNFSSDSTPVRRSTTDIKVQCADIVFNITPGLVTGLVVLSSLLPIAHRLAQDALEATANTGSQQHLFAGELTLQPTITRLVLRVRLENLTDVDFAVEPAEQQGLSSESVVFLAPFSQRTLSLTSLCGASASDAAICIRYHHQSGSPVRIPVMVADSFPVIINSIPLAIVVSAVDGIRAVFIRTRIMVCSIYPLPLDVGGVGLLNPFTSKSCRVRSLESPLSVCVPSTETNSSQLTSESECPEEVAVYGVTLCKLPLLREPRAFTFKLPRYEQDCLSVQSNSVPLKWDPQHTGIVSVAPDESGFCSQIVISSTMRVVNMLLHECHITGIVPDSPLSGGPSPVELFSRGRVVGTDCVVHGDSVYFTAYDPRNPLYIHVALFMLGATYTTKHPVSVGTIMTCNEKPKISAQSRRPSVLKLVSGDNSTLFIRLYHRPRSIVLVPLCAVSNLDSVPLHISIGLHRVDYASDLLYAEDVTFGAMSDTGSLPTPTPSEIGSVASQDRPASFKRSRFPIIAADPTVCARGGQHRAPPILCSPSSLAHAQLLADTIASERPTDAVACVCPIGGRWSEPVPIMSQGATRGSITASMTRSPGQLQRSWSYLSSTETIYMCVGITEVDASVVQMPPIDPFSHYPVSGLDEASRYRSDPLADAVSGTVPILIPVVTLSPVSMLFNDTTHSVFISLLDESQKTIQEMRLPPQDAAPVSAMQPKFADIAVDAPGPNDMTVRHVSRVALTCPSVKPLMQNARGDPLGITLSVFARGDVTCYGLSQTRLYQAVVQNRTDFHLHIEQIRQSLRSKNRRGVADSLPVQEVEPRGVVTVDIHPTGRIALSLSSPDIPGPSIEIPFDGSVVPTSFGGQGRTRRGSEPSTGEAVASISVAMGDAVMQQISGYLYSEDSTTKRDFLISLPSIIAVVTISPAAVRVYRPISSCSSAIIVSIVGNVALSLCCPLAPPVAPAVHLPAPQADRLAPFDLALVHLGGCIASFRLPTGTPCAIPALAPSPYSASSLSISIDRIFVYNQTPVGYSSSRLSPSTPTVPAEFGSPSRLLLCSRRDDEDVAPAMFISLNCGDMPLNGLFVVSKLFASFSTFAIDMQDHMLHYMLIFSDRIALKVRTAVRSAILADSITDLHRSTVVCKSCRRPARNLCGSAVTSACKDCIVRTCDPPCSRSFLSSLRAISSAVTGPFGSQLIVVQEIQCSPLHLVMSFHRTADGGAGAAALKRLLGNYAVLVRSISRAPVSLKLPADFAPPLDLPMWLVLENLGAGLRSGLSSQAPKLVGSLDAFGAMLPILGAVGSLDLPGAVGAVLESLSTFSRAAAHGIGSLSLDNDWRPNESLQAASIGAPVATVFAGVSSALRGLWEHPSRAFQESGLSGGLVGGIRGAWGVVPKTAAGLLGGVAASVDVIGGTLGFRAIDTDAESVGRRYPPRQLSRDGVLRSIHGQADSNSNDVWGGGSTGPWTVCKNRCAELSQLHPRTIVSHYLAKRITGVEVAHHISFDFAVSNLPPDSLYSLAPALLDAAFLEIDPASGLPPQPLGEAACIASSLAGHGAVPCCVTMENIIRSMPLPTLVDNFLDCRVQVTDEAAGTAQQWLSALCHHVSSAALHAGLDPVRYCKVLNVIYLSSRLSSVYVYACEL